MFCFVLFSAFGMMDKDGAAECVPVDETQPSSEEETCGCECDSDNDNRNEMSRSRPSPLSRVSNTIASVVRTSLFPGNVQMRCTTCNLVFSRDTEACRQCGSQRLVEQHVVEKMKAVAKICALCGQATGVSKRDTCKGCGGHRWFTPQQLMAISNQHPAVPPDHPSGQGLSS